MNDVAGIRSTPDGSIRPLRLAMWSGPRNISTAMMRAFENRPDTLVWDEPFYAYYLHTTGLNHPLANEIIQAGPRSWQTVVETAVGPIPDSARVWYQKHMAQHFLPAIDRDWLREVTNCFLIRDPLRVVASYRKRLDEVTVDGLGFAQQTEIFEFIRQQSGQTPLVIDAKELLMNPEAGLRMFCERLEIPFYPQMLRWPAGPRESDGVWARHWYDTVQQSTGFAPYVDRSVRVPDELMPIVNACQPHYDRLFAQRMAIPQPDRL